MLRLVGRPSLRPTVLLSDRVLALLGVGCAAKAFAAFVEVVRFAVVGLVAIGVGAFVPMIRRVVRPVLRPVMIVGLSGVFIYIGIVCAAKAFAVFVEVVPCVSVLFFAARARKPMVRVVVLVVSRPIVRMPRGGLSLLPHAAIPHAQKSVQMQVEIASKNLFIIPSPFVSRLLVLPAGIEPTIAP